MAKVSIIMPVYNEEQYLEQCLDSICGQTFKETEIICVDDGSTDATPEILNNYAERDHRIFLLKKKILKFPAVLQNIFFTSLRITANDDVGLLLFRSPAWTMVRQTQRRRY